MLPLRTILEDPFPRGERFAVVVGPSRAARRATRALLGVAAASGALGLAFAAAGRSAYGLLEACAAALILVAALRAICGGTETVVCESRMLIHRRWGALGDRRRALSTDGLLRIRLPAARERLGLSRGIRIEWRRESWTVFRLLGAREALWIAEALQRHLMPRTADPLASIPFPSAPSPRRPARSAPEHALRPREPRPGR
jgi:hypothetical protein